MRALFTSPYSWVAKGIANGEFTTMTDQLTAARVHADDTISVALTAAAGESMLKVLAALRRLDVAVAVLQEVGGLLGLGTSVASLLTHAVGTDGYCSPRHSMAPNSRNEDSNARR